jgi:mono/diheme cytochrome c family protein
MKAPLATLSALALAAVCSAAQAQDAPDGQALYQQHCVKCHAEDGAAGTWRGLLYFAEDLSDADWQQRHDDAAILRAIQRGPGAMPAYAERLDEAHQQAVLQHVRSLRR